MCIRDSGSQGLGAHRSHSLGTHPGNVLSHSAVRIVFAVLCGMRHVSYQSMHLFACRVSLSDGSSQRFHRELFSGLACSIWEGATALRCCASQRYIIRGGCDCEISSSVAPSPPRILARMNSLAGHGGWPPGRKRSHLKQYKYYMFKTGCSKDPLLKRDILQVSFWLGQRPASPQSLQIGEGKCPFVRKLS